MARKCRAIVASWMSAPALSLTLETPRTSLVVASATLLITPWVLRIAPARSTTAAIHVRLARVAGVMVSAAQLRRLPGGGTRMAPHPCHDRPGNSGRNLSGRGHADQYLPHSPTPSESLRSAWRRHLPDSSPRLPRSGHAFRVWPRPA